MTNKTKTNTKKQKAENHNGRGNIGTRNKPTIEEFPDSMKETLNNEESIIGQNKSPLYTNGRASRTAITNLMMT